MRKIFLLLFLCPVSSFLFSQINLVPNPSFEDMLQCPTNISSVNSVKDWFFIKGTPDYINSCSSYTGIGIPDNAWGHEFPYTTGCKAYCGFNCGGPGYNYQEWMGCKLSQSLTIGQKYFVSFKLSLADSLLNGSDNVGIFLTTNSLPANTISYNPSPFNTAHFRTLSPTMQKTGWTNIFGSLIADSAYAYLGLGNFFAENLTNFVPSGSGRFFSTYYFVDDICLSTDSAFCKNYFYDCKTVGVKEYDQIARSILIFPNPATDIIHITCSNYVIEEIQILNSYGQPMLVQRPMEYKGEFDLKSLPKGQYFAKCKIYGRSDTFIRRIVIDK